MLTLAGGLVLGFFGVCGFIFLLSMLLRTPATPDVFGSLREAFRGFRDGMKKP